MGTVDRPRVQAAGVNLLRWWRLLGVSRPRFFFVRGVFNFSSLSAFSGSQQPGFTTPVATEPLRPVTGISGPAR
jgi:hypothetical protein